MQEIALRLRFRVRFGRARDWNSSGSEACPFTETGQLAMRTKSPSSLHSCLLRPLPLFHFLTETSAQANPMLGNAHPESPNMLVGRRSPPIVREVCGGWSAAAGHFLLADDATYSLPVTRHCERRRLPIKREMERSAYPSRGETEPGSAGERNRRRRDWVAADIRPGESLPGCSLWAGNSPNALGSDIQSLPHASENSKLSHLRE